MTKHEQITLPAENATVQERQVAIRVLTIGTKQVTQTLYRQLIEESVVDEQTGMLKGKVWGWVNLHGDDRCGDHRHFHAIWEDNGQLKRSYMESTCIANVYFRELSIHKLTQLASEYTAALALTGSNVKHSEKHAYFVVKGRTVVGNIPKDVAQFWSEIKNINDYRELVAKAPTMSKEEYRKYTVAGTKERCLEWFSEQIERALIYSEKYRQEIAQNHSADAEQIYAEMEKIADELNLLQQNWKQSFETIEQAGQLFVAVSGVWK